MHIYTVEQMQALEKASDSNGYSYEAMMAQAGQGVAQAIEQGLARPSLEGTQVLVLVGPGNNGGDGLVAARALAERGCKVVAYVWKREEEEPLLLQARRQNVSVVRAERDEGGQTLERAFSRVEVVVDALFGIGLSRPIEGEARAILATLRAARAEQGNNHSALHWITRLSQGERPRRGPLLVAVDVPSGLQGDTGEADPATVAADLTVTFAGPKRGMFTASAAPLLGELIVVDIGVPAEVTAAAECVADLLTPDLARELLPPRPAEGHKGTFGTVLVIGGSTNYVGAPMLSALGAGRSGAGLVTLAVPSPLQSLRAAYAGLSTVTWLLLPHDMGVLRPEALKLLRKRIPQVDALVLGPGLGGEEVTQRFVWGLLGLEQSVAAGGKPRPMLGFARRVEQAAEETSEPTPTLPPTVIDADGLNALAAREGEWWEKVEGSFVLTPHPGEMARLLRREAEEVQADRLATAREAATLFRQVVVLKGAYTVVAAPDGRLALSPFANDALAKAGSGDVLAGMIGALLGQGMAPYEAACLAVIAHGLAGERLRLRHGGQGSLASDLIDVLSQVWKGLATG